MNKIVNTVIIALAMMMCGCSDSSLKIPVVKGKVYDTEGNLINAHGGNIMEHDGLFYWYGEHRGKGFPGLYQKGVTCYTSPDLINWENRGVVLKVSNKKGSPIEEGGIIERPKVVYNPVTKKFVMWFHNELKGQGYAAANAAVAVADSPTGPFTFVTSGRVNPGIYPVNYADDIKGKEWSDSLESWSPDWLDAVKEGMLIERDLQDGQMARDMTIFVDDDGKAYHIYSSEENLTLHIAELNLNYTRHTGKYIRVAPGGHNEAPTMFKHGGKYWMITSGCTGWSPNEARLLSADSIMGEWTVHPNPCRGQKADKTFGAQGSYVMNINGNLTFMADIWKPKNLDESSYMWLPIQFDKEGVPYITFDTEI